MAKKAILLFSATALVLLFLFSFASAANFVTVDGNEFMLKGKPFHFAGANNYYLWYGQYNCANSDPNNGCSSEIFKDAVDLNLSVLRVWGFSDGSANYWGQLQPSAGVYNESAFKKMDKMVAKARQKNLKLIITLTNNWNDFGGMCQYVKWCHPEITGTCTEAQHDLFYTDPCVKTLYKNYVRKVVNRVNTLNGIAYKNDPTIMAWELANEARATTDITGTKINNWIEEMSNFIKLKDPNHLITTGIEGYGLKGEGSYYYGTNFIQDHNHPNIDYVTFHLLAENMGFDLNGSLNWITAHLDEAAELGKPVVVGEIGKRTQKASYFKAIYNLLESREVGGDLFWMLKDARYPNYDGYGINYPEDTGVVSKIRKHASNMRAMK